MASVTRSGTRVQAGYYAYGTGTWFETNTIPVNEPVGFVEIGRAHV